MDKKFIVLTIILLIIYGCSTDKTIPVVSKPSVQQDSPGTKLPIIEESDAVKPVASNPTAQKPAENKSAPKDTKTFTVTIQELKLSPQDLTINKGDTVIWKHEDRWETDTKHYLTAHSNEFRSPVMKYGETFSHTFNTPGIYTYIDPIHKDRDLLYGKIIVEQ
ncbi:MAG TPA: hypothetical protein VFF28_01280 [Candidatus Nanoarchaeia archaeon]|nr:hypothetical protein [Candidatus Nanoarchaeia archaeon]